MSKIRSSYFLSENSLRYIDEYKEKNNLSSKAVALDNIIMEHEKNTKFRVNDTAKLMSLEIGKVLKEDIDKFKVSARETDKNVQILIEMINGFFIKSSIGEIVTTTGIVSMKKESPGYQIAKDEVKKRIHKNKIRKSDSVNE